MSNKEITKKFGLKPWRLYVLHTDKCDLTYLYCGYVKVKTLKGDDETEKLEHLYMLCSLPREAYENDLDNTLRTELILSLRNPHKKFRLNIKKNTLSDSGIEGNLSIPYDATWILDNNYGGIYLNNGVRLYLSDTN